MRFKIMESSRGHHYTKVLHKGLIHKLKTMLPNEYSNLEFYLSESFFGLKQNNEYSELKEINAGIPQGSVGPVFYLLYMSDIPILENTIKLHSAINSVFA